LTILYIDKASLFVAQMLYCISLYKCPFLRGNKIVTIMSVIVCV